MKKIIGILVTMLMITMVASPVLGEAARYESSGQYEITTLERNNVTLDVAITTDWVNDWQDHGLRIREYALDGEVWAYHEISSDDLFGLYFEQTWWYDNGTGLENKWSWAWTITEHWTSSATWSWWQIGLDYGPGVGYVECFIDNVSIGQTNWYAIDNTQPNIPIIDGPATGTAGTAYDYDFTGTDPDGFEISYFVDWGDGTDSGWTDFVTSGTMETLSHTWTDQGEYTIKCKVKDLAENESNWKELTITMPRNKADNYNFNLFERLLDRLIYVFPMLKILLC